MKLSFKNLFSAILLALMVSVAISFVFDCSPVLPFVVLMCLSLIPQRKGVAFMGLSKEIWKNDIIGTLFRDNQFAQKAVNADSFVLNGSVVHIPVAGTPSSVTKNRAVFPATANQRTDTEVTYPLDTFTSDPRHIKQIDKYELSYDKRMSVLGEDIKKIQQDACNGLLFNWGPLVAQTILTTGALGATENIDATATGNRRAFDKAQFATVKKMWARGDVLGDMNVLMTPYHYFQFLNSLTDAERTAVGRVVDMKDGIVGQYLGINIMMRSSVLRYRGADGAYVKVDEGDVAFAANAADRAASLFWTSDSVERALGDVEIFDNPGQALYYGDVFSLLLRMGGRIRRPSGVIAAVEGNV